MLAGSKLVADSFEAKFHYAIWFQAAASNHSIMEFGFYSWLFIFICLLRVSTTIYSNQSMLHACLCCMHAY